MTHPIETTEHTQGETDSEQEFLNKKAILSLDNLGIAASVLCLIHCLAMPFVVALLPFLGLKFLESHESHLWLGAIVIGLALVSIIPGYLKHKRKRILSGMIVGISLVLAGSYLSHIFHIIHEHELWILIAGNLILVTTHLFNKKVYGCCDEH